jgi:hypothetical protein
VDDKVNMTKLIVQEGVTFKEEDATEILRTILQLQREFPDNKLEEIVFQRGIKNNANSNTF